MADGKMVAYAVGWCEALAARLIEHCLKGGFAFNATEEETLVSRHSPAKGNAK
jgi:hypothetical protein